MCPNCEHKVVSVNNFYLLKETKMVSNTPSLCQGQQDRHPWSQGDPFSKSLMDPHACSIDSTAFQSGSCLPIRILPSKDLLLKRMSLSGFILLKEWFVRAACGQGVVTTCYLNQMVIDLASSGVPLYFMAGFCECVLPIAQHRLWEKNGVLLFVWLGFTRSITYFHATHTAFLLGK